MLQTPFGSDCAFDKHALRHLKVMGYSGWDTKSGLYPNEHVINTTIPTTFPYADNFMGMNFYYFNLFLYQAAANGAF